MKQNFYVAIDIGGTNIKSAIIQNDEILVKSSIKTLRERCFNEIFKDIVEQVYLLLSKANIDKNSFSGIGVGCPGIIDSKNGVVVYNWIGWKSIELQKMLIKEFGKSVIITNDASAALLGEVNYGAAVSCDNVVLLTLGTGIGGGILINGKLYEGNGYAAGEVGHMVIVKDGKQCNCGRKGCFESYASVSALVENTKHAMNKNANSYMWQIAKTLDEVNGKTAFLAKEKGDATASDVAQEFIEYLSLGIANICNILRPQTILIGGGICEVGNAILQPIQEYVNKNTLSKGICAPVKIQFASLGNDAALLGAYHLIKNSK